MPRRVSWLPLVLATLCMGTGASAAPRLAMGLFRAPMMKASLQAFLPEHLAQQLQARGLSVVSARDITAMLGLERRRQLLGCEESSCQTELIGALGADGIVLGEVADLDGVLHVNVKVISSDAAKPLATFSTRVAKRAQLAEALERAATDLAAQLLAPRARAPSLKPPEPIEPIEPAPAPSVSAIAPEPPSRAPAVITGAATGLLVAASATLALVAKADHDQLAVRDRQVPLNTDASLALANRGATCQAFAIGTLAAGGAAAVATVLLFAASRPAPPITVAPIPGGASLFVGGQLP